MTTAHATEGQRFNAVETFEVITCCNCGIPFGVPSHWRSKRREDRKWFYCPNGHKQCYQESTEQRLRAQLEEKQRQVDRAQRQIDQERQRCDDAKRQRDAARKSHRKMRDRVKNGVCPCCSRSFDNLLRHMQTEHPEYGEDLTLKQIREVFGMTQADVARELGLAPNDISRFERGRTLSVWSRDQIESWIEDQCGANV